MSRYVLLLLAVLSGGQSSVVHAAEPTLDSLKQTYEAEVQKIQKSHGQKLKGLLDAYGMSLDKAIEILRKEGDPDPVLTANAEKMRFEEGRTVPNLPADDLPKTLQAVQAKYHEAVRAAQVERGRRLTGLTKRYIAALDRLMRNLTNEDRLDLAVNVKAEKERVEVVLGGVAGDAEHAMQHVPPRKVALPEDAVEWKGHHYLYIHRPMSWTNAFKQCQRIGGHLVAISSEAEQRFIMRLRGRTMDTWIGARQDADGQWRWAGCREPFKYASWPDAGKGAAAVVPDKGFVLMGKRGHWLRTNAGGTHVGPDGYICEWDY